MPLRVSSLVFLSLPGWKGIVPVGVLKPMY